jgi:hypothetical protein
LAFSCQRIYRNNSAAASGIFGNNWHFPFDRDFLSIPDSNGDGLIELRHRSADGRLFTYASRSNAQPATYQSPAGFYDTLKTTTWNARSVLVQRNKFGTECFYEFHLPGNPFVLDPGNLPAGATGYLVRMRDRNLNELVINRHPANDPVRPSRIREIIDDLGRTNVFTYSTVPGRQDLVASIGQFQGFPTRDWLFEYDANGSLVQVSTPVTTWSQAGAPVTTRKVQRYAYTPSSSGYNLTELEDGNGHSSLQVAYDGNDDVISMTYGSGADSGTAVYSYRRDNVLSFNQATQVDRNGNVLLISHENTSSPPFWNIRSAAVYTRGLHGTLPFPEPQFYESRFVHDHDTEIIEAPNENVQRWIRDEKGNIVQFIFKAASSAELEPPPAGQGADYKREEDIVWDFAYETNFNQLIRVTSPRGNSAEFVGSQSNIVGQLMRTAGF